MGEGFEVEVLTLEMPAHRDFAKLCDFLMWPVILVEGALGKCTPARYDHYAHAKDIYHIQKWI